MTKKRAYFPNDWEGVFHADYPEIDFDEFMIMRGESWVIPSSVCVIIRASNKKTGKVQEFTYQKPHAAKKRIEKLMLADEGSEEILLASDGAMHMICGDDFDALKD